MTAYDDLLGRIKAQLGKSEPIRYSGFGTFELKPRAQGFILNMLRGMVRNGIFAATDKQLVLCMKKRNDAQLFSFPYAEIDGVSIGRSMLGAYLDFTTAEHKVRLRLLNQGDTPDVEALIKKHAKLEANHGKKPAKK